VIAGTARPEPDRRYSLLMGFRAKTLSPIIVNGDLTTPQILRGGGYARLINTK
jgi:hypothetical protein